MDLRHTELRRGVFSALPPSNAPVRQCIAVSLRHTSLSEVYDRRQRPLASGKRFCPLSSLQHPVERRKTASGRRGRLLVAFYGI